MRTGYLIAQELKNISTPNNNDRLARALFVAHAVGYSVSLVNYATAEQAFNETEKDFNDILNQVNENVAVDTKLSLSAYRTTLRIRFDLLNGVDDPAIVHMALNSGTTNDYESQEQVAMTQWLTSRGEFAGAQRAIKGILTDYFAGEAS